MKNLKNVATIASLMLLFSCGNEIPTGSVEMRESSIIVGDVDWREITELSENDPKKIASKAVVDIQFANGGRCSGFMISDDVLMTNEHCIGSAYDVVGMKVYLRHEFGQAKADWAEIKCNTFLGNDAALDFALAKCEGAPGARYGKAQLEEVDGDVGSEVYVIHQNCDYYTQRDCDWSKKLSEGQILRVEDDIFYDADTLGGSSGSPVFSADSNKVIAIHHFGHGGTWTGRGESNSGVPMKQIVPVIKARFPGVLVDVVQPDPAPTPTPAPGISDDNESFATAVELSGDVKALDLSVGSSEDVDFYKFEMKSGEVFDFKIKFSHAQGDLDFNVYKKSGTRHVFIKKKDSANDDESLVLKANTTTTYFVKVFGYKGATAKYDLEFSKK